MKLPKVLEEDLSSLNRKVRRESALNLGILLDEARQKRSYEGLKKENLPFKNSLGLWIHGSKLLCPVVSKKSRPVSPSMEGRKFIEYKK